VKKDIGILMVVSLILQITFSSTAILTILILPIHEHGRFFCLLTSLSICCINVL
jgi:hypothetical protein